MSAEASALPLNRGGGLKSLMVLVGIAGAVAIGVAVAMWTREPNYTLLITKVSGEDIASVAQTLESSGIPYKTDTASGSVSVAAERLNDARLKLAGEGLPSSGGFASLTRDTGFGSSQLMENARFQYAQELELAKTIANLQPVSAARVHLAIPEKSAFIRDRRTASASVFVQLKSGRRLENEQVTSIVNLVASSIPGMEPRNITVIDQQGRLLSSPQGEDEFAMRDRQYEFAHKLEDMYRQRVMELLSPLVGDGNVRAQVVADVELSMTEETRELYNPQSQVVRSEQTAEQMNRDGSGAQGVPGALTNQPPAGGTAAAPNVAANDTGTTTAPGTAVTNNESKQSTRNYEIDRTLAYTKQLPGKLKRLTVAVLVDNLRSTDAEGKVTTTPLTEEQLQNMNKLVRDAVGFDEKRGDSVNVVNSSFQTIPAAKPGELLSVPLWEKPWFQSIAKLLIGLIVLLVLILSVLKPLIKNLITPTIAALPAAQPQPSLPPQPDARQLASQAQQKGYEQQVADARTVVNQDPARVAQVVKTWVADGNE